MARRTCPSNLTDQEVNMAIVADRSGISPLDKSFVSHNRTNAGEPNAALTPQYAGEIVLDTTNNCYWKAMGVANNTWVALTPPN
jgi:hypothetical protein